MAALGDRDHAGGPGRRATLPPGQPSVSPNEFFAVAGSCARIQHFHYSDKLCYPDHTHNETSVVICLKGTVESTQLGRKERLLPGEVLITNRGTVHSSRYCTDGDISEGITLDFNFEAFARILHSSLLALPPSVDDSLFLGKLRLEPVAAMARTLLGEIEAGKAGYEMIVEGLARRILIEVVRSWPLKSVAPIQNIMNAQLPRWEFIKAIQYMHYCKKYQFRLESLCRELATSPSRFSRLFRNTTGQSPLHCYNRLLMDSAFLTLQRQERSVKDVAYSLGFKSVSHFCFLFKLIHGSPPLDICKILPRRATLPVINSRANLAL